MQAYYHFIKREQLESGVSVAHYQPTKHAQGAWNEHEQHMAPATGLLYAASKYAYCSYQPGYFRLDTA